MQFVKTGDLKTGMRLARPIYDKKGALLYAGNTKLAAQDISSIRNSGLIGIYVLEPAEPAPPMTSADVEFERFQTVSVFLIEEELTNILKNRKTPKTDVIVSSIIKEYGHLEKKINFIQNLRSKEDYIYKHALNTAILCALITSRMNLKVEDRIDAVTAAVSFDIGRFSVPAALLDKTDLTEAEEMQIYAAQMEGFDLLGEVYSNGSVIKRICVQAENALYTYKQGKFDPNAKFHICAKVLVVADTFERMTAMQLGREPESKIKALKYLQDNPKLYDEEVVRALVNSINLLTPGVSVELNTGEKALVLTENPQDVLRPMVLGFKDNTMMDLSNKEYDDLEIVDVMRSMDSRHVMDMNALKQQGFAMPEE